MFLCALLVVASFLGACAHDLEGPYYSATGTALIGKDESFQEGRLDALQRAERRARDQILTHILENRFSNGATLDEAMVTDPFIRAKVYDTIRSSKITDQTVSKEGVVNVTVQLDKKPIEAILNNPEYAALAKNASGAFVPEAAAKNPQ